MADLIHASALKRAIAESCALPEWARVLITCVIDDQETVDAVPVIRCKDCKHSRMYCFGCSNEPVLACCEIEEYDDGYEFIRAATVADPDGFCSNAEPVEKPVESVDK